jgi:peptide/nickel transport system permease protein
MAATNENLSPNRLALLRLRRNRPAMFGVGIIVLALIPALFGYTLAPDSTPDANDQMPLVALKNPGFSIDLLKMRKNRTIPTVGFFKKMLFGAPNPFEYVPINASRMTQDSIFVERYADEDPETGKRVKGLTVGYPLVDVVYALQAGAPIQRNQEAITFTNLDGQRQIAQIIDLKQVINNNYLVKKTFWLGTDNFGRDNLSRLLLGVRVSLLVGLIAVLISLTIGILFGALAGFFGGRIDDFIMLIINTVWSIPTILLVFAIVLALGRGIGVIFLAVGLTMWVDVARIVRGQVLSLKEMLFIEATRSMGFSTARAIWGHILPNVLGPVMVVAASNFATAILVESGLSYLGFGIQPPAPSWGTMLNENYGYAIGGKPFLAVVPAIAILLMVLAFNLVGNGFRDALDVKTKD